MTNNNIYIPLGGKNGGVTVVDVDYTHPIHCFHWLNHNGYAKGVTPRPNVKFVSLHRMLINAKEIHHINNKPLDNRLNNLKGTTKGGHTKIHSKSYKRNKSRTQNSKYPGVRLRKDRNFEGKVWNARIMWNGKRTSLGWFEDPISAHIVYEMIMEELYGSNPL